MAADQQTGTRTSMGQSAVLTFQGQKIKPLVVRDTQSNFAKLSVEMVSDANEFHEGRMWPTKKEVPN